MSKHNILLVQNLRDLMGDKLHLKIFEEIIFVSLPQQNV